MTEGSVSSAALERSLARTRYAAAFLRSRSGTWYFGTNAAAWIKIFHLASRLFNLV